MVTSIHIISGFLGAGKTTFIKKLIPGFMGKTALIENEFGEVGVDGDLFEGELAIREIQAGCICCSVVGDFQQAVTELMDSYQPNHIIIEPSGVAGLTDIIRVCKMLIKKGKGNIRVENLVTIVDVTAFEDYLENFGSFYRDQILNARTLFLSHLESCDEKEIKEVMAKLQEINPRASISSEDWSKVDGETLRALVDTLGHPTLHMNNSVDIPTADQVFSTLSIPKPKGIHNNCTEDFFRTLDQKHLGSILRVKGILSLDTEEKIYVDYTPHHKHWEYIKKEKEEKLIFIGSGLEKKKIFEIFNRQEA